MIVMKNKKLFEIWTEISSRTCDLEMSDYPNLFLKLLHVTLITGTIFFHLFPSYIFVLQ